MRLIDADALNDSMYHEAFETDSELQKWDSGCWIRYKMFENHLENAPTIDAANTCEWIKYDYRTMCPKNHGDVDNSYWRIPTDMKHLLYCPYCGKRIRLVD